MTDNEIIAEFMQRPYQPVQPEFYKRTGSIGCPRKYILR